MNILGLDRPRRWSSSVVNQRRPFEYSKAACKDAQGYSPRPKGMLMGSGGPIQSYTITTKSYPKPSNPHEERNTSKDSTSNCCVISLHRLVPPSTMKITPPCSSFGQHCMLCFGRGPESSVFFRVFSVFTE